MASKFSFRPTWYEHIKNNPTEYYVPPFRIYGNLYFVGNKDAAIHLVDTGEGLILFDTGFPHMGGLLLQSIWSMGFDPADIKMIFHTHGHFDHFGATKFLVKLSGAKTYLGSGDAKMFRENPGFALCDYLQGIPTEMFTPDVEVEDGDVFTLGKTRVRAFSTPGHSQGAVTYKITVTDGEKELTALLCGGTGFNSLNVDFLAQYPDENWRPDFEESIEKWKNMDCDIYLGNHSGQSNTIERREQMLREGGNPFIDGEIWKRFVADLEAGYKAMIAEEG